uniref:Putative phage/plasmid DNA primase n=1 Tax=Coleochaete scutata TaxID=3125 RepID=A0A5P9NWM7_COLSC|nr:putative phage/plasmid DNA primase [Coleochaete scutata]QFU80134.1 putative phage/plasmid DNA primase [Coleochaete scutata]
MRIKFGHKSYLGEPRFTLNMIVLENGVLNLKTRDFLPYSPDYFVISKLLFSYDKSANCPHFLNFLDQFCLQKEDRKELIRSWFYALVHQLLDLQIFMCIICPGGSGKSTMALVATALVGHEATITTTLKSLRSDTFETINLRGKKLIMISNFEQYVGDLSIFKQIVGGDALKGRVKHVQGSFEVPPEGMVVLVGNKPLQSRDSSNAIRKGALKYKLGQE